MTRRLEWRRAGWAAMVLGCGLMGCQPSASTDPAAGTSTAGSHSAASAPTPEVAERPSLEAAPSIHLEIVDRAGFDAMLAKHRGKVILVDAWATWCVPCVQGFPKSVEMAKRWKDRGFELVTISFDDVDQESRVREFLTKQGATGDNALSRLDLADDGAEAFEIADGALPNLKIYDREGRLVKAFGGADETAAFTHHDVEQAVEAALTDAGK